MLPRRNNPGGYLGVLGAAILAVVGGVVALRRRRQPAVAPKGPEPTVDAASAGPPAPAPEPRTETETGDER